MALVLRRLDDPSFEVALGDKLLSLGTDADKDLRLAGDGIAGRHVLISGAAIEAVADVEVGGVRLRAGRRRLCVPSVMRLGESTFMMEARTARLEAQRRATKLAAHERADRELADRQRQVEENRRRRREATVLVASLRRRLGRGALSRGDRRRVRREEECGSGGACGSGRAPATPTSPLAVVKALRPCGAFLRGGALRSTRT